MPILQVYVSEETLARLELEATERCRSVTDLAECAIAETALHARRHSAVRSKDQWLFSGHEVSDDD